MRSKCIIRPSTRGGAYLTNNTENSDKIIPGIRVPGSLRTYDAEVMPDTSNSDKERYYEERRYTVKFM